MRIVVIGDIHAQAAKFWSMLQEIGLTDSEQRPTDAFDETKLVLLGDLIHAKSRERYAELTGVSRYDEYNPEHIEQAETAQETFLSEVKTLFDSVPEGNMTILMGNHDYNAVRPEQGPLRTDDVVHLEWKEGHGGTLDEDLSDWMQSWPHELVLEGIHFAHVGPLTEHNTYDNSFYLQNRRRWIYEDTDFLTDTPYRLGVYGHTPVRGGVNIASQGRAILLDTNGHGDEYTYLDIEVEEDRYRLKMRGLFFDEWVQRTQIKP